MSLASEPESGDTSSILSNKETMWLAILIPLFLLLYYSPALTGQKSFYTCDTCYFFEPFCHFVRTQLLQGHFPLWNPDLYCGISQAAMPSPSLFYPFSYLLFLLPFSAGLACYMLFHQGVMALGSYLLCRDLRLSRESCMLAAISAGLMSYCFSLTRNPTLPASAAWFPLALFLQRHIDIQKSKSQIFWRLGFALCVAMTISAGRPEVFAPCLLVLFCDGSLRLIWKALKDKTLASDGKLALISFLCLMVGVAIAAPTLAPAMEWTKLSPRGSGLSDYSIFSWSANWFDFLSFIFSYPAADLCSSLTTEGTIAGNLLQSKSFVVPLLTSSYVSPILITFGLFGFCNRKWKSRIVFLLLLIFADILVAGRYTPIAPFLVKTFPVFAAIRYPVKLFIFPVMLTTAAAVMGFDAALRKSISNRQILIALILWVVPILLASLFFILPNFYLVGAYLVKDSLYSGVVREVNNLLASSILQGSVLGSVTAVAVYLLRRDRITTKAFSFAIPAALACSLFASNFAFPSYTTAGFFDKKSALMTFIKKFLQENAADKVQGRVLPLYHDMLNVPVDARRGGDFQQSYMAYMRYLGNYNTTLDFDIPQSKGYEASETERYTSFFQAAHQLDSNYLTGNRKLDEVTDLPLARFCRFTASEYVLTQEYFLRDDIPLPILDEHYFELYGQSHKNNSRIYRVVTPLSRIYFADDIELVDSWDALKHQLLSRSALSSDGKKTVFLIRNSENDTLAKAVHQVAPQKQRKYSLDYDDGQSLQITTDTAGDEVLLISDQNYPGWVATLDGKPVEIIYANIFSRAFKVPAGKHELRMHFAPNSVTLGLSIAFIAVVLLVLTSLFI